MQGLCYIQIPTNPVAWIRPAGYSTYFEACVESLLSWPSLLSVLMAKYHLPVARFSMTTVLNDGLGSDNVREYELELWP